MLKYAAPLQQRLRHLNLPPVSMKLPARKKPTAMTEHHKGTPEADELNFGQRLAEYAAAVVGSWRFLSLQAVFLAFWLLVNAAALTVAWDRPPYILLNLLLSFEAAFTGPILLIAANAGALRDHKQYDRMEQMERLLDEKLDRLLRAQRGEGVADVADVADVERVDEDEEGGTAA